MEESKRTDAALVAAANGGERSAFEELYLRHRDWAYGVAFKMSQHRDDALDVVQDTFVYFFQQFPGFQLTGSLRAYLYTVIRHRSISKFRKRRKVVSMDAVDSVHAVTYAVNDVFRIVFSEIAGDARRVLQTLDNESCELLLCRFSLEMKLDEIAEAMDLNVGTVKSRLHNLLKRLKKEHLL